jgi:hypothetical protein
MHQVLAAVVGAVLSAIGFVARRWIRKDRLSEVIERRLKLVALYQKMVAAGLDDGDLDRLERRLADGPRKLCTDTKAPSNTTNDHAE